MPQNQLPSSPSQQQYIVQTPSYQPFKLTNEQNNLSKSVFQIQSDMRTRNFSNIGRSYHNQNYLSRKGYPSRIGQSYYYYPPTGNGLRESQSVAKKDSLMEQRQGNVQRDLNGEYFSQEQTKRVQSTKFSCKSCILIVVCLLILAVLAGFVFLIMTNQLQQTKYFVLTKVGLWRQNQPDKFYGNASGSHPVTNNQLSKVNEEKQKIAYESQTESQGDDGLVSPLSPGSDIQGQSLDSQKAQSQQSPQSIPSTSPTIQPNLQKNNQLQQSQTENQQQAPSSIDLSNSVPAMQQPFSQQEYIEAIEIRDQSVNHKTQNLHAFNSLRHYTH